MTPQEQSSCLDYNDIHDIICPCLENDIFSLLGLYLNVFQSMGLYQKKLNVLWESEKPINHSQVNLFPIVGKNYIYIKDYHKACLPIYKV